MPNNNAARRLIWLMQKVREANNSQRATELAADVWPHVFDITGHSSTYARDHEVGRLLDLALEQVNLLESQLRAHGAERDTFDANLNKIRNAISLRALNAQWQQYIVQPFDDGLANWLKLAADILPEDEPVLSSEQLASAREVIAEFRQSLASADLPPHIMTFLGRQLAYMESALRAYPIAGARAFRDAAERAAADWVQNGEEVKPYENDSTVKKAKGVWPRIQELAPKIVLVHAAVVAVFKGAFFVAQLAHGFHVLPPAVDKTLQPLFDLYGEKGPKLLPSGSAASDGAASSVTDVTI
jgi:hypothetical protein